MLRTIRGFVEARGETITAVLIVAVSVIGAGVTWRAAKTADDVADFDQRGRQAEILSDQIKSEAESTISYEKRLYQGFRDHVETADSLEADAARHARSDRELSRELSRQARGERAVARALEMPFSQPPVDLDGRPAYDANLQRKYLLDVNSSLAELAPARLANNAEAGRDKRFWLVAVDTAIIAAVFFLTVALLSLRFRRSFALGGAALALGAVLGWVAVEVFSNVPSL